jgi:hypothetical protein
MIDRGEVQVSLQCGVQHEQCHVSIVVDVQDLLELCKVLSEGRHWFTGVVYAPDQN